MSGGYVTARGTEQREESALKQLLLKREKRRKTQPGNIRSERAAQRATPDTRHSTRCSASRKHTPKRHLAEFHAPCLHIPQMVTGDCTDGKEKFIWKPVSGQELFFDLKEDPGETRNLAEDPAHKKRVDLWRTRLIKELAPRVEDGLTDGERLLPGKAPPIVRAPH